MTNRSHEEDYPSGKIWCTKCRRRKPIADFQLQGEKPPNHREGVDWWKLFYEERPYGMWEGCTGVACPSTYESLIDSWEELTGVMVTKKQIQDAQRRGRIVLDDPIVKSGYVVAHPWEESAFCRECRDRDEVRQWIAAQNGAGSAYPTLKQCAYVRARRAYQYRGKCFLCREGDITEGGDAWDFVHDDEYDWNNWVYLCDGCTHKTEVVQTKHYHDVSTYLADHVTDFPGVNHTLLKLEDPPLDDD